MVLGGLQKNSLIDYPGKVCCVLFLAGCNFNCPYCHNPGLVKGCPKYPASLGEKRVYEFLDRRKEFLDGVVISGGEPTLEKDLPSLCNKIQRIGYPVKLDTNGSRPGVIRRLIDEGLVDYIAMDIKTDPFQYPLLIRKDFDPDLIFKSIQVIMESAPAYEFRTTCVRPIVDASIIENIVATINGAMLYALQRFHHAEVLKPEFFREIDAAFDEDEMMHLKSIAEPWVKECIIR